MTGYGYSLVVQNDPDPVHTYTRRTITEIYLPIYYIAINSEGYCFQCEKERSVDYMEIDVPDDLAKRCFNYVKYNVKDNILYYFAELKVDVK